MQLNIDSKLKKANTFLKNGEISKAKEIYMVVANLYPGNVRAKNGLDEVERMASTIGDSHYDSMLALYNANEFVELATKLEKLLSQYPKAPHLWKLMGALCVKLGDYEAAEKSFNTAIDIRPNLSEAHYNLGSIYIDLGRYLDAIDALQTSVKLSPNFPIGIFNLALCHQNIGDFDAAIKWYQRAIEVDPNYAEAHNNLGNVYKELENLDCAIQHYKCAICLQPDNAIFHENIANTYQALGDMKKATKSFEVAAKLSPTNSRILNNFGVLIEESGDLNRAIDFYSKAILHRPDFAKAYNNLGNATKELGDLNLAKVAFLEATRLDPDFKKAFGNLAALYTETKEFDLAVEASKNAITSFKEDTALVVHYLNLLSLINDWDEVVRIQTEHQGFGLNGDRVSPFAMLSLEDNAHHQLLRSQSYSKKLEHLDVLDIEEFVSPARSGGKLRLGYFSSDFRDHPVLHLLMGMLREHDRSSFELYGYSSGRVGECAMREEAKGYFDVFTDINEMSDADVVKLARGHQLDAAINLSGYTYQSRSSVFAHRVAPVQINYLGYPSTMGADFMDYIVADKVIIPEEYQQYYSEKVLYLPDVYLPNDDKREVANTNTSRSDFGLPEDGFVFCCFNSSYKISPAEFDVWMRILGQVEGSVLWLSNSNKWAVENLKKEAEKRGVSADRIIFASRLEKNSEHLARHKHADLFIDTFNYNAHTTAGDALMTGLPLVTKQGEQFAARVASSLLHALDLDELVTRSVEEYEALILELATKPEKLKAIKAKLAKSLASKPVFDTKTYTQNFEQIIKNAG